MWIGRVKTKYTGKITGIQLRNANSQKEALEELKTFVKGDDLIEIDSDCPVQFFN